MKRYRVGQLLTFVADDGIFGTFRTPCKVTGVYENHAIAEGDGMHLWIDKDTEHLFEERKEER